MRTGDGTERAASSDGPGRPGGQARRCRPGRGGPERVAGVEPVRAVRPGIHMVISLGRAAAPRPRASDGDLAAAQAAAAGAEPLPPAVDDLQGHVRAGPPRRTASARCPAAGPGRRAGWRWRRTTGPGTAVTTTSTPSIRAATTVGHSGPGFGTSASRSRAMPLSAAASAPSAGTPTTAHQEPARDAAASSASSSDVPPPAGAARPLATATVLPRRRPRPGSSPLSSGSYRQHPVHAGLVGLARRPDQLRQGGRTVDHAPRHALRLLSSNFWTSGRTVRPVGDTVARTVRPVRTVRSVRTARCSRRRSTSPGSRSPSRAARQHAGGDRARRRRSRA